MKKTVINLFFLFLFGIGVVISLGFIFKIEKYETNYIIPYNQNLDKIVINKKSYFDIQSRIKKNFFEYKENNQLKTQKIVHTKELNGYFELYLKNLDNQIQSSTVRTVMYFLKKQNYWSEII